MYSSRVIKLLLGTGLSLFILAAGFLAYQVNAHPAGKPVEQASLLHPTFALLDTGGVNVLESKQPVSTMRTCGQCHDTDFIASHSFHVDLGMSEQVSAGQAPGGQPWDTSTGLYGKWNPLTYRYLSPEGDTQPDLDNASWIAFNASRLVGGGPAALSGVELNCFVCHTQAPNNEARVTAIQSGKTEWASTATLMGSGIVEATGEGFAWNPAAFSAEGELAAQFITIQDPTNENCSACHGLVHSDNEEALVLNGCSLDNWQTATSGQIVSGQKISLSGMNIAGKSSLARAWDVHAERGLSCTDCHFSINNPAYYQEQTENSPAHLAFDPRRLEIGEYLQKPDHNFAHGGTPDSPATMRRCESCHDAGTHADWLPYEERHMEELACESCHIPRLYAPAVQSYDWTVLTAAGQPAIECRGVEGDSGTLNDLVTGFQPALLQRQDSNGKTVLAPYNLVTSWYWVHDAAQGPRPVSPENLQAAWLADDGYAPEVLQALDSNGDGKLDAAELKLETPEKRELIAARLEALGLQNPRIMGQVQSYRVNHGVARGEWATSDCQSCHSDASRLAASLTLSGSMPAGVLPEFSGVGNITPTDGLSVQNGALVYSPDPAEMDLFVFGHNRVSWVDWLGGLLFLGVLLGVAGHGGMRFYQSLRRPPHQPKLKQVYMYAVYERFWHWLQTFTIVLLLFTGLIIHRPELFGWLSFRHMVTLHNIMAAILVINAALSLFYHLASGEIQQFIPRPYGFFDQAIVQAKFYLRGIFKGDEHPFEKTPTKKLNPLQQVTYFGILNVLLPLQVITGALMWGVQKWPQIANMLGGLPFLAPFHSLVAWTFGAFIVGHVYLTTTGHEPLAGIKAMMNGWEDVEEAEEMESVEHAAADDSPLEAAVTD